MSTGFFMYDMFAMFSSTDKFLTYFMSVLRIGALMFTLPVFSSRNIASTVKIFIAMMIGVFMFPYVNPIDFLGLDAFMFIFLVAREVLLGFIIGQLVYLLFNGVIMGADSITNQSSLSLGNMLDPSQNMNVGTIAQFYNIGMLLVFIIVGGVDMELRVIKDMIVYLPIGYFDVNANVFSYIAITLGKIFVIALEVFAPIFVVMLCIYTIQGVIGKLVPQMNIMVVGAPLNIVVSVIIIIASYPYFLTFFRGLIDVWFADTMNTIAVATQTKLTNV